MGLSALSPSVKMVSPVQNGQYESRDEFRISHLGLGEHALLHTLGSPHLGDDGKFHCFSTGWDIHRPSASFARAYR